MRTGHTLLAPVSYTHLPANLKAGPLSLVSCGWHPADLPRPHREKKRRELLYDQIEREHSIGKWPRMLMLKTLCLALLLSGAALPAFSQQPPATQGQRVRQGQGVQGGATADNFEQRGTDQAPFVIKLLPSPLQQEATTPAFQQPRDFWPGWSTSDVIASVAAIAGVLQAIALAITIFVLIKTARRQLRAYVLPESGNLLDGTTLDPPNPDFAGEPGVVMKFINTGSTPAFQYLSWAQLSVAEPANTHAFTIPPLEVVFPATVGGNGGSMTKLVRLGRKLTQSEIADIGNGVKMIFVYGRIEYRDAFKRKRWSNFRLQYAGAYPPPKGSSLFFSNEGNEAN